MQYKTDQKQDSVMVSGELSHHPDAYVTFFPWGNVDTSKGQNIQGDFFVVKDEILSLRTTKSKTGSGKWNLILAGSSNFNSKIYPGCWAAIYISNKKLEVKGGNDLDSGLKMIGIVRSVRRIESTDPSSGIRSVKFVIVGEDLHSALESPIYINAALANQEGGDPILSLIGKFLPPLAGGYAPRKPHEIIQDFLTLVFTGGKQKNRPKEIKAIIGYSFTIPGILNDYIYGINKATNFLGFCRYLAPENLEGETAIPPDISGTITAWSLLKTFSNPILNEIFTEIVPHQGKNETVRTLQAAVLLRPIPFSKTKIYDAAINFSWGDFATLNPDNVYKLYVSKQIQEYEIIELNHGKNDSERFNFFLVTPSTVSHEGWMEAHDLNKLIVDKGLSGLADNTSVSRYGLRPYVSTSIFKPKNYDFVKLNKIVKEMWQTAHLYDNGVVTIPGSAEQIPVGTNIEFLDRGWLAHVENVDHSFAVDVNSGRKTYRTEIAFVRLCNKKNGEALFLENSEGHNDYDASHTFESNDPSSKNDKNKKIAGLTGALSKFAKGLV